MPAAILQPATDAADLPAIVELMNLAFRGKGSKAGWSTEANYIEGDRTTPAASAHRCATPAVFSRPICPQQNRTRSKRRRHPLCPFRAARVSKRSATQWSQPVQSGTAGGSAGLCRTMGPRARRKTVQMHVVNVRETLIAWYVRRGYHLTGKTHPFPYNDHRFGTPLRNDLAFVVLEKSFE